jgi:hypothetical protein
LRNTKGIQLFQLNEPCVLSDGIDRGCQHIPSALEKCSSVLTAIVHICLLVGGHAQRDPGSIQAVVLEPVGRLKADLDIRLLGIEDQEVDLFIRCFPCIGQCPGTSLIILVPPKHIPVWVDLQSEQLRHGQPGDS